MSSKAGKCFGVFLIACFFSSSLLAQVANPAHNSLLSQLSPVKLISFSEAGSINPSVMGSQLVIAPVAKPQATVFFNADNGNFMVLIKGTKKNYDGMISDISGKAIRQFILGGANEIHTGDLPTGLYTITITGLYGKGENFSQEIIIR